MTTAPLVFKSKAMRSLRGNWQTALLVSFMAGVPGTLVQLFRVTQLPDVYGFTSFSALEEAVHAVPPGTWIAGLMLSLAAYAVTPALQLGCNLYFINRAQKRELGTKGLFARMRWWWKALLLNLLTILKITLWSLLLIVPGIIAGLRYALAPYYLAQEPEIGVLEALKRSKETMKEQKATLFLLQLSFLGWLLAALLSQLWLSDISAVLGIVVSQCIQLYMITYMNAAVASFYLAVSVPGGTAAARAEVDAWIAGLRGGASGNRRHFNGWIDSDDDKSKDEKPDDETEPDGGDGPDDDKPDDDPGKR